MTEAKRPTGSQTLSRGIEALKVLGDAEGPVTISELTGRLGLHRSITYRIVRTLEDHGLVTRDAGGGLALGPGFAALARNVAGGLQAAALPELTLVANELGMTAFLAVLDGEDQVVTLASVEPRHGAATVVQRPGSRHSIHAGAPGRAIRRQLQPGSSEAAYETSHDEVIAGLSSVAVPLAVPGQHPVAVAVVYVGRPLDAAEIGHRLARAAEAIGAALR
ncbi:IclR family transcriptional regulator [Patulibacter americanus]|uniref:IclR family transcriptional regulator n=1 Tax=Patulibacter americanus TaxID=588672 RepID=UPI0003B4A913|nr:helix-turn-helix domain-containing protein [Patulibacter americanus]